MKSPRRGFSLVLSLAVMGLLVLVLLSVAGFLTLESRIAASTAAGRQARLNAVAAARLALAQLQQLAGNDQRVTARADLLLPSGTGADRNTYLRLTKLSDQRRWWTGVWVTGGADGSKIRDWNPATPDSRLFAGWLVSPQGNDEVHSTTLDRNLTVAQSEAVVRQVEVTPTSTVRPRVALLGGDSLPAGTTLANGRVESDVALFPGNIGGYAWWTADEGIKARANLIDPLAAKAGSPRKVSPGANDWWRGFAGVAVGRVGVELAGTTQADVASLPLRPSAYLPGYQASLEAAVQDAVDNGTSWALNPLLLATTREGLQAWAESRPNAEIDAATRASSSAGVARGWHDLTATSRGVLTNTLDGGLRVDLSVAFELPFATSGTTKGWSELDWFRQSPDTNSVNLASVAAVRPDTAITPTNEPLSEEWNNASLKLGFVFEVPIPSDERGSGRVTEANPVIRGPTWDLLRNHYRLYKREREALSAAIVKASSGGATPTKASYTTSFTVNDDAWLAHGMEPYTFAQGATPQAVSAPAAIGASAVSQGTFGTKANFASLQSGTSVTAATTNYRHRTSFSLLNGYSSTSASTAAQPWPTRARLAPHMVRAGMVHSLIYINNAVVIGLDPFVVLHNPYNVPVEFIGVGMNWALFNNTRYDIHRADTPGAPVATCKLGADGAQRTFSYRMFGTSPPGAWKKNPTGNLRMLPGEVQIVTPNLAGDRWQVPRGTENTNVAMGTFLGYDLNSNFRITAYRTSDNRALANLSSTQADIDAMVAPAAGAGYSSEPLYVQMVVDDQSQYNAFQLHLFRSNRYGSTNNPYQANDLGYRAWSGNAFNAYADTSDEHLLQHVAFRARPSNLVDADPGNMIKSPPFNRSPQTDQVFVVGSLYKNFFAITDLRLRSAAETNGFPMALAAMNPRAAHADPRNLDNGGDTSPGWSLAIRRTSGDPSINEFQMVPGTPVGLGRSLASWGNSFLPGSATTPVILYQVPTRPLLSLAQLVHADIGLLDTDSGYAIGNSMASPWLDSLDKVVSWPTTAGGEQERVDLSYAANLGLWDRAFFSGFNAGSAKSADGTAQPYSTVALAVDALFAGRQTNDDRSDDVLANRRMTWGRFPLATAGDTALKASFLEPTRTAKQLVNEGAFNVNSTSVAAWKAQLASGFQALASGLDKTPEHPFSRQHPPTGESVDVTGSGNTNRWSTYRSLSESDGTLTKLAEAIVAEVRARGPFMSLSDFVNRRLVTDANGRKGALQAAIDAVASPAINAAANGATVGSASARIRQPGAISPTGSAADIPVALGRPDMVLQSDVLAALGPGLSARSDTFVIRAYGEHKGAGAWCEVTVQRTPEWVLPSNEEPNKAKADYRNVPATRGMVLDTQERNPALGAVNHRLGRRFVVVGFRWVNPPAS